MFFFFFLGEIANRRALIIRVQASVYMEGKKISPKNNLAKDAYFKINI